MSGATGLFGELGAPDVFGLAVEPGVFGLVPGVVGVLGVVWVGAPGFPGVQQVNVMVPPGLGGMTTQLYACGTSSGTEVCSLPVPLTLK